MRTDKNSSARCGHCYVRPGEYHARDCPNYVTGEIQFQKALIERAAHDFELSAALIAASIRRLTLHVAPYQASQPPGGGEES